VRATRFHFVNREFGALAGNVEGKGAHSAMGARFFPDENFVGRSVRWPSSVLTPPLVSSSLVL
jgi:hypothetical protein